MCRWTHCRSQSLSRSNKQNIPFEPIVDENDESFDRYGGTKDRHLDQPRGGRKQKQQSYDDSEFKHSLKSDELNNLKKPNIFGKRRHDGCVII